MKTFIKTIIASVVVFLALHLALVMGSASVKSNEVIFKIDFKGNSALQQWDAIASNNVQLDRGYKGSQSLRIECPTAQGMCYRMIRTSLPLEKLRGQRLLFEAMVKAENVARPDAIYHGVKFMLNTESPAGPRWVQQDGVFGTFEWKPIRFYATVPKNITKAGLVIGIEATTGQAWFDDIKVSVVSGATGLVYKGQNLPRLRGAMISPQVTAKDLEVLGLQWKANHVRWQLLWDSVMFSPADKGDLKAYDAWLETSLARLDQLLPVCEKAGLKVVIDLHTPPGGRSQDLKYRLFQEQQFQDAFLQVWDKIADRYRGNKVIWGYDLLNEPAEGFVPIGLMNWHTLSTNAAQNIRAIDEQHPIIVESAWGSLNKFKDFEPLPIPGIIYSVHMYEPFLFTHQGFDGRPAGVIYPGNIDGKLWNQEQLRQVLQPVVDYQHKYGVPIYIGEFSAIRWAPGDAAYNYLHDVIEIFENNRWNWAYHAFREWNGWSVEYTSIQKDELPSPTPTTREKLLRAWFAKNPKIY